MFINYMKAIIKYMKPYFSTKKKHPLKNNQDNEPEEDYILFTYRSNIQKALDSTYYSSDSGWGCMLRVGQMFIGNILFKKQKHKALEVIRLFYDNKPMPFSIQMFTNVAKQLFPEKKQFDWFSPCECGFLIKNLLDQFDQKYRVSICNDNCMFRSQIQNDRQFSLILVMMRIGLDQPNPEYLKFIIELMKYKYFFSILGGTPKKAHLFLEYDRGYLGFLDPHNTQKTVNFEQLQKAEEEFHSSLSWIKQKQIDSSMAVSFYVPNQQFNIFWEGLLKMKEELGESFIIYMADEKPELDENAQIIEIIDDDF